MPSFQIDESIRLETPRPEHAGVVTRLVRKNLAHLQAWMPWAVDDYGVEQAQNWIALSSPETSERFDLLVIYGDEVIGTVGFHDLDKSNRHTAIGYWIDQDHQGKGIITRCCKVLVNFLFDTMELNRIQINCNVDNARSRAIPERLGFTLEGILRQVELLNGEFRDWAVYGLLRGETTY